ncbi:hypothetical protein V8G54_024179 [Vigna mungo]|uniref:Uncharacterized protein n=1 Tax=Vigna mungo TaxID=3915 RepID=A0AAQ3N6W0_VIGMU
MTLTRWSSATDEGNSPEKLLSLRKIDLRLIRAERSGTWPESEFPLKLRTRSWSKRFKILASREPVRLECSRTSFLTLPLKQSLTPVQVHTSAPCRHGSLWRTSMEDLRASSGWESSSALAGSDRKRQRTETQRKTKT